MIKKASLAVCLVLCVICLVASQVRAAEDPATVMQALIKMVDSGNYPGAWNLITPSSQNVLCDSVVKAFEKQFPTEVGRVNRNNVARDLASPNSDRARYAWEPFRNRVKQTGLAKMAFVVTSNDGKMATVGIKGNNGGAFKAYLTNTGWRIDLTPYL